MVFGVFLKLIKELKIKMPMLAIMLLFLSNISAANFEQAPEWTRSLSRTVISGDILYLGVGDGSTPEVARFKAEAMSVKALISECSLAHRDIIIWDRHIEVFEGKYKAYVRAGLSFESCTEAKKARGEKRKNLANQELMRDQETYSELEGLIPESEKNTKNILKNSKQIESLKADNNRNKERLKQLEEKIVKLERAKSEQQKIVIIKEKEINVRYEKAQDNEIRYNDCMEDYRVLMNDATQTAYEIGVPRGNLASPGVYQKLNRAEQKLRYCQNIKPKK